MGLGIRKWKDRSRFFLDRRWVSARTGDNLRYLPRRLLSGDYHKQPERPEDFAAE